MTYKVTCPAQGIGITPYEALPKHVDIFTEITIPETVTIPHVKPDMEVLNSVTVDTEIVSIRLIKTAEGTSREGQILSGYKLIVELKLREKVKYVADEPTQKVHAAHFEKIISSVFVVVPATINGVDVQDLFDQGKLIVTPYIEDIFAVMKDKRTFFKNITILLNVTTV